MMATETPSTDVDVEPGLPELRHRLAICQQMAEQQRQRADNYYALFCEGARANAQLRHGGDHVA